MKKLVTPLLMFALIVSANQLSAQDAKAPSEEHKKEKRMDKMASELNLTDAQKVKIEVIHKAHKPERDAIKTEMKKLKSQMKEVREKEKAEVRAVLTPEQQTKFDEMQKKREEHKEHMKKERHQHH